MDVPDFEPPNVTPPPAAQPPPPPPPAPPSPWPRRIFRGAAALAGLAIVVAGVQAMLAAKQRRLEARAVEAWSKSQDATASVEARQLLAQKERARLQQKLSDIRALLDEARGQRAYARKVQELSTGLDACAALIQAGDFDRADKRLEEIKRGLPQVQVHNPLPVGPKPIDVPAPPAEKITTPQGATPAGLSRKKPKKKAKTKKKKKVRKPAATDE